jgi:putative copper export protein
MTQSLHSTKRASLAFALSIGAGLISLLLGLIIGGGAAASALADAGDVVRFGQPIAKLVMNFSTAVAVGSLIFTAFALQDKTRILGKALDLASAGAIIWAISGALNFLFTYLYVSGSAISFESSFGESLWMFATSIEMGTSLALNILVAVVISVLAIAARSLTSTALLAALGLVGLVPLALIGHAARTAGHAMAVNSIGIHLVAVVIWVGGLVALFTVRGESYEESALLTRRYSTLALAAFGLIAISGVASASIRITKISDIFSAYGALLILKVAVLVLLGVLGAIYRTRLVGKLAQGASVAKSFYSLVAVEFVLMGTAIGFATALAKTAPPLDGNGIVDVTPAQLLTGEPLPPELTPIRWLTVWKLDLVWAIICVVAVAVYLVGVRRLAKRGDKWPMIRTVSWVSGMVVLFYTTSGALNAYQEYLLACT